MTLHQIWDLLIPEERRLLSVFIFVSLVLHASTFYFFHPPDLPPRMEKTIHPQVSLLMPSSPSGDVINAAAWINLFDPRVLAIPSAESSFNNEQKNILHKRQDDTLPLRPVEPIPAQYAPVALPSPGNLEQRALISLSNVQPNPRPIIVETPPRVRGTRIQFSGDITNRTPTRKPDLPQPRSPVTLKPTILRMAVDSPGNLVHILVDESCGDSSVDLQAVKILRDWRFTPLESSDSLQWGRATIFWDLQSPSLENAGENQP